MYQLVLYGIMRMQRDISEKYTSQNAMNMTLGNKVLAKMRFLRDTFFKMLSA